MKVEDFVHEVTQTSAIFGRQKDVSVEFTGEMAYTDGNTIVLPSLPQGMEFDAATVSAMRGYLDHEAGHIRHTDFTNMNKFGDAHGEETFGIFNSLEDMRLERKVMDEYPGAEKNLRSLMDSILPREHEYVKSHPELFTDEATQQNIGNAIRVMGRKDYNSSNFNELMLPTVTDKWKAWGNKWNEEVHKCKDANEVMNLAIKIAELLQVSRQEQSKPKEEQEEGKGLDGDPADFEFDKDGDPTKGSGKGKGKPTEAEVKAGKAPSEDISSYANGILKDKIDQYLTYKNTDGKVKYRVLTTKYDEVYSRTSVNKRKDYRVDYMKKHTTAQYEKHKSTITGQINTMRSRLRRALMAKERRDWDYGRQFGKLDTKRLVAGYQGAEGVYKQRKDCLELDTSVMMLVDLSGSMSDQKVRVARDAVIAFAECLEGTQIKYEINGFDNSSQEDVENKIRKQMKANTTYHRIEPLNIFQFKGFLEPLRIAKGAIAAISDMASGNNSDRDAVLWCLQRLADQRTTRKVLIVLSDGQPANFTVNADRDSLTKALKDVIDSAEKDYGVETIGIGILTDHVERIYPKSIAINKATDLAGGIFTKLAEVLTGGKVRL